MAILLQRKFLLQRSRGIEACIELADMRIELAKQGPNVEKKEEEKRNSQHR